MHRLVLIGSLLVLLLTPFAAEAVGPRVGTGCVGSWVAPTTYNDNITPLVGTPTFNVWVLAGVQTVPAVPPTFVASGLTLPLCAGRPAGQYTLILDDFVVAGTESAFATFPFVLVIPSAPTGLVCTAGVCSWNAVTTFTDATAITGAVTYNLTLTSSATPPAPPIVVGTSGTSVPIAGLASAGSYTARVSAVATPTPGGSISESAVSAAVPFVTLLPNPPSSVTVK